MWLAHLASFVLLTWPVVVSECEIDGVVCCVHTYGGAKNFFNAGTKSCEVVLIDTCGAGQEYESTTNACIDVGQALDERLGAAPGERRTTPPPTTTSTTTTSAAIDCGFECLFGEGAGGTIDESSGRVVRECGHGRPKEADSSRCTCNEGWTTNVYGECVVEEIVQSSKVASINGTQDLTDPDASGFAASWMMLMLNSPVNMLVGGLVLLCSCALCCTICRRCCARRSPPTVHQQPSPYQFPYEDPRLYWQHPSQPNEGHWRHPPPQHLNQWPAHGLVDHEPVRGPGDLHFHPVHVQAPPQKRLPKRPPMQVAKPRVSVTRQPLPPIGRPLVNLPRAAGSGVHAPIRRMAAEPGPSHPWPKAKAVGRHA